MTANDAIRNYRAMLLGRMDNTKNEIESPSYSSKKHKNGNNGSSVRLFLSINE